MSGGENQEAESGTLGVFIMRSKLTSCVFRSAGQRLGTRARNEVPYGYEAKMNQAAPNSAGCGHERREARGRMHHGASASLAKSSIPAGRGGLDAASGSGVTSTSNENRSARATNTRNWLCGAGCATGRSEQVRRPEPRGSDIGDRLRFGLRTKTKTQKKTRISSSKRGPGFCGQTSKVR